MDNDQIKSYVLIIADSFMILLYTFAVKLQSSKGFSNTIYMISKYQTLFHKFNVNTTKLSRKTFVIVF